MGAESTCTLRRGKKALTGTALLETDFLLFRASRGEDRVRIELSDVESARAEDGVLHLRLAKGTVALELGAVAARWADKITRPKGLLEKLGVRPGAKVALVGGFDDGFVADLDAAGARVTRGARGRGHDHVIVAVEKTGELALARIEALVARLVPSGGVWIVYPKGRKDIREADVIAAGRGAGLVDVKVARFSETHTALRFVVPIPSRAKAGRP